MRLATIAFITVISSLAGALPALAQVSIQTDGSDPHGSAMLDVKGTTKGMLVPRVALSSTASSAPINPAPAASLEVSLLVYNTATAGDVTPGYYYWDGSAWIRLMSGNTPPLLTEVDPTFTGAANTTGAISRTGAVTVSNRLALNSTGFDEHLLIQRTGAPDARLSTSTGAWIQMWPGASGDYVTKGLRINNSGTIQLMGYGNGIVRATASNGTLTSGGGVSLTSEVTGLLPVANGGTGIGTLTGVVIGNGTAAMGAAAGTASQFLRRNAANTAYEFVTMTPAIVGMTNLTFNSAGTGAASGTAYNGSAAYTISYNTIGATGGSGTLNYVSKFTGTNTIGNSQIFDNGTNVGIGNTTLGEKLHVSGNLRLGSTGAINAEGESLQFMQGVRADDNAYEWAGFYSGTARQGIILYDGAWTGANNITDEFSITAENGNRLTLNTQSGRHIALMPKGTGNVGINTLTPVARLEIEGPAANWNETTPGLAVGSIHLDPGSTAANLGSAITWGAHDASAGDNAQAGIYVRSDGSYGTKMYLSTTDSYATGAKTRLFINHNGDIGVNNTAPTHKLQVTGDIWAEGRYIVQNATDGGTTRGIRMWTAADANWGIYMSTPGASKSLAGGTAVGGGGITSHAIRFRAHNGEGGFIFENSSEQNLFSIKGNNGRATFRGGIQLDCVGCGSTSSIDGDGSSNWGTMTLQGRVISANDNIHLSPPGGANVIINTAYRAAGGAAGTAGLQVQSLAGTGNRPVYADGNGTLSTTGNAGWTMSSDLAFSPDDISGHSALSGDDNYANVNMPFSVQIDGVNHSAITISTNGWVAFGTIYGSIISTGCLPNGSFSVPVVAWYMRDLVTVGTNIRYLTVGSSPNRTFIVDFEAYAYGAGSGDRVRGQVQIHETSSMISVKYRDTHNTMNGQNAVIGFQMAGGSSSKAFPITCLGKVMDDNRPSEGWSVSPVR